MTLIEVLIATVAGIVVILALFAILEFSASRRLASPNASRRAEGGGPPSRTSSTSCTPAAPASTTTRSRPPSTTPTSPTRRTRPHGPLVHQRLRQRPRQQGGAEKVYEHDIHWASTGKSKTGETLGHAHRLPLRKHGGSGPAGKSASGNSRRSKRKTPKPRCSPRTSSRRPSRAPRRSSSTTSSRARTAANSPRSPKKSRPPRPQNEIVKVSIGFTATSGIREHLQRLRDGRLQRLAWCSACSPLKSAQKRSTNHARETPHVPSSPARLARPARAAASR